MALRLQKKGSQNQWLLDDLRDGLEKFYIEHKRYPTALEIDNYSYLPSSRQIQRRFGGLVELRQKLGLQGPVDFTKGEYSSTRARTINKRGNEYEKQVYDYLVKQFGLEFVHREYLFTDDGRSRTDFFIYDASGNFSVDVFYPKDIHSLVGCLNSKASKYLDSNMLQYQVIFLQMNSNIADSRIKRYLAGRKKTLRDFHRLYTWNEFKAFCQGRKSRKSA